MSTRLASVQLFLQQVKHLIAPPRCMGCLREGVWFCRACAERVPPFALSCVSCEQPQSRGITCNTCRVEIPLKGVITAGPYHSPWLRRGIHWLKFKGVTDVAPDLSALLARRIPIIAPLQVLQQSACFVPIPLHRARQRERGFNQSSVICQELSVQTGIPTIELLHRTKSTYSQSRLPKELRADNLVRAFSLAANIPDRISTAIIVDDVTTSGSTLSTAAKALRTINKDIIIWGATIARG